MVKILLVVLGLGFVQTLYAQTLKIGPALPETGQVVKFSYSASSIEKQGSRAALYYMTANGVLYGQDVTVSKSVNNLKGSFAIPRSAVSFAMLFAADGDIDNNKGKGYLYPIAEQAKIPASSYLGLARMYMSDRVKYILNISSADSVAEACYQKAVKLQPSIGMQALMLHLLFLKKNRDPAAHDGILKTFNDSLSAGASESNLLELCVLYAGIKPARPRLDSLLNQVALAYPRGRSAAFKDLRMLNQRPDLDSVSAILTEKKAFYEGADFDSPGTELHTVYDELVQKLMDHALKKGDSKQAADLVPLVNIARLTDYARQLLKERKFPDLALSMARRAFDRSISDTLKPLYQTESEWKSMLSERSALVEDTYACALFSTGKPADALFYQSHVVQSTLGEDENVNERYIHYLLSNGRNKETVAEGKAFIIKGKSTAQMDIDIQAAYRVLYPGEDPVAFVSQTEKEALRLRQNTIRNEMIDLPAKDITFRGLTNKAVSLKDYKGKIIVLDFWATWCGPCQMAFPGMQLAVDHYKDSQEVKFLFVNTSEATLGAERLHKISSILEKDHYTFDVVIDEPQKTGSKAFRALSTFNIPGLPTKLILDQRGHIRFKFVGYNGPAEHLRDEVIAAVELLKQKN